MKGDQSALPLAASSIDELKALSHTLHDWWIALPDLSVSDGQFVVHLEAEGTFCGPDGDWQAYRLFPSGEEQWEAPPSTYLAALIFRGVTDVRVADPAGIDAYTIKQITGDNSELVLSAEPDLTVALQVRGIDVVAREGS